MPDSTEQRLREIIMIDEPSGYHWASDPWFTEALDRFIEERDKGRTTLTLDLEAIEDSIFNGDGAAYRLMEAMASVIREEGHDGCRGAPRVLLATLQRLSELKGRETP